MSSTITMQVASGPSDDFLPPYEDLAGQVRKLNPSSIALGGFSDVYLGEWTDPSSGVTHAVAIKILRGVHLKGPERLKKLNQRLARESRFWRQFNHPNVLPFYGLATDNLLGPCAALISPFCTRGTVLDVIKKDQTVPRFPIIVGVAKGLQYLHKQDAIHGDLKAQNVLMSDEGLPMLSDFGRSKFVSKRGYTTDFSCAYRYLAPELMDHDMTAIDDEDGTQKPPSTTKATDVYSFSLIGVEVLGGVMVYPGLKQDFQVLSYVAMGGRPRKRDYPRLSPEAAHVWPILEKCWVTEPEERPSMDGVLSLLGS